MSSVVSKLYLVVQNNSLCNKLGRCVSGQEFRWLPFHPMLTAGYQWRAGQRLGAVISLKSELVLVEIIELINRQGNFISQEFWSGEEMEIVVLLKAPRVDAINLKELKESEHSILLVDDFFKEFNIVQIFDNINDNNLSLNDLKSFYLSWKKVNKSNNSNHSPLLLSFFTKYIIAFFLACFSIFGMFIAAMSFFRSVHKENPWETTSERIGFLENVIVAKNIEIDELKLKLKNKDGCVNWEFCRQMHSLSKREKEMLKSMLNVTSLSDIVRLYFEVLNLERAVHKHRNDEVNRSLQRILDVIGENNRL